MLGVHRGSSATLEAVGRAGPGPRGAAAATRTGPGWRRTPADPPEIVRARRLRKLTLAHDSPPRRCPTRAGRAALRARYVPGSSPGGFADSRVPTPAAPRRSSRRRWSTGSSTAAASPTSSAPARRPVPTRRRSAGRSRSSHASSTSMTSGGRSRRSTTPSRRRRRRRCRWSAGGCSTGRRAGCCRAALGRGRRRRDRALRRRARAVPPHVVGWLRGAERERCERRTAELVTLGAPAGPGRRGRGAARRVLDARHRGDRGGVDRPRPETVGPDATSRSRSASRSTASSARITALPRSDRWSAPWPVCRCATTSTARWRR